MVKLLNIIKGIHKQKGGEIYETNKAISCCFAGNKFMPAI